MKKLLILIIFAFSCKKIVVTTCYLVEIETVTTLHEGHSGFNSYGKDNQTFERKSFNTCNKKTIDSLINLGSNVVNGNGICISYHRVLTKTKKD